MTKLAYGVPINEAISLTQSACELPTFHPVTGEMRKVAAMQWTPHIFGHIVPISRCELPAHANNVSGGYSVVGNIWDFVKPAICASLDADKWSDVYEDDVAFRVYHEYSHSPYLTGIFGFSVETGQYCAYNGGHCYPITQDALERARRRTLRFFRYLGYAGDGRLYLVTD